MARYSISWSDPHDRLFDITIRFVARVDGPRLLLPAWRPGRYLIQDYAANVREWAAEGRRVWKEGKSEWRVDAHAGEDVAFSYRYYAGVLDAGSSFLDGDEAYFNGSNLFMLVEGERGGEQQLTVALPADWQIECQLPRVEGERSTFRARDYDHLIDSPVIGAATMTRHTFRECEATVHLVFRGDEGVATERFVEPVRAIVKEQAALFGGLPFDEYRFLIHLRDRWHGVEHEDSCSIIVRRDELAAGEGDDHFLSIVSHELFHVWNVKRIMPARFAPYDYWRETPTRLLWAMEGTTSYYGDLTLVRSGLWSVEHYLQQLAKAIESLESFPARAHLSLAQAGFDGWLAHPAAMHDLPNAWYSFYTKGEIVSALLDLTIREATGGAKSLDDVMRILWNDYGRTGSGLEEDAIEKAVARVADTGDFFARFVDGTDALPYGRVLEGAGISCSLQPREPRRAALAARLKVSDGRVVVDAAMRGGAGMAAGLLPGDEIIALDGTRVGSEAALDQALRALAIGRGAELLVARAGRLAALQLEGRPDPRPRVELKLDRPNERTREWLGRIE